MVDKGGWSARHMMAFKSVHALDIGLEHVGTLRAASRPEEMPGDVNPASPPTAEDESDRE